MKTRKIMELNESGLHFTVIKTDDKYNPYRIYEHYNEWDASGKRTQRKVMVEKYADLNSVFIYLYHCCLNSGKQ